MNENKSIKNDDTDSDKILVSFYISGNTFERIEELLFYLKRQFLTQFCNKFKIAEMDFISLFIDQSLGTPNTNVISLKKLVAICYPLNISIIDMLKGVIPQSFANECRDENSSAIKFSQMFLSQDFCETKSIRRDDIEKAKVVMNGLLKKEPIPFYKVSQIVGIRGQALKNLLPVLSLHLSLRFKAHKKKLRG